MTETRLHSLILLQNSGTAKTANKTLVTGTNPVMLKINNYYD